MHAPNVLRVNWCQFDDLVDRLSRAVLLDGAPQVIVAIQRGGLIPGVCLSHRLATRALVPFECATTINDDIGADKVFPTFREMGDLDRIEGKDVLLVDDIVGSGATLRAVTAAILKYRPSRLRSLICFLNRNNWVWQEQPENHITYLGEQVSGWVVFPWEEAMDRAAV